MLYKLSLAITSAATVFLLLAVCRSALQIYRKQKISLPLLGLIWGTLLIPAFIVTVTALGYLLGFLRLATLEPLSVQDLQAAFLCVIVVPSYTAEIALLTIGPGGSIGFAVGWFMQKYWHRHTVAVLGCRQQIHTHSNETVAPQPRKTETVVLSSLIALGWFFWFALFGVGRFFPKF